MKNPYADQLNRLSACSLKKSIMRSGHPFTDGDEIVEKYSGDYDIHSDGYSNAIYGRN
jgi:hypothetical protein